MHDGRTPRRGDRAPSAPFIRGSSRFANRLRRLTMNHVASPCTDRSPVLGTSQLPRSLPSQALTASRRVDASCHPDHRWAFTLRNQNTNALRSKHLTGEPAAASRTRAFHLHGIPAAHMFLTRPPHSREGALLPRLPHPCGASTADAVHRCDPLFLISRLPWRCIRLGCMTVGRPMFALQAGGPNESTFHLAAEARASQTPGNARSLQHSHPVPRSSWGTFEPRTCQPLPLDSFDASLSRDVQQRSVPLDTQHLSMLPLCRRASRGPARMLALRPACCELPCEQGRSTRAFDESSRHSSLLPRQARLQSLPGGETMRDGLPHLARRPGRVDPLQALTTPGKTSPIAGQSLSWSSLPAGSLLKQGMMSARLRGLHPSTSPLRHSSVRRM